MRTSRIRNPLDLHNALGELDFRLRKLEETQQMIITALFAQRQINKSSISIMTQLNKGLYELSEDE